MAQNTNAAVIFARIRTNEFYRAAFEAASPEFAEAARLREKLLTAQRQLPGVPAVAAPGVDIDAWLDAVTQAEQAARTREVQFNAITSEINQCNGVVEGITTDYTDEILAHLHDALMEVMDQVAAIVDRLGGAVSARAVIATGASAAAWRSLQPLRVAHDAVRQGQEWAMSGEAASFDARSRRYPDDPVASDLWVANLDSVFPGWHDDDGSINYLGATPPPEARPWPVDDPVEQLAWLAASPAEPWVPTLPQLAALRRQRQARANQPPADDPDDGGAMHQTTKQTFAIR